MIIPHEISYFYPDINNAINEINGLKYVEIPYNFYFEDTRGNDVVFYEAAIDKRTANIPDVIGFVDEINQNIINVTNGKRSVTVPSQIT